MISSAFISSCRSYDIHYTHHFIFIFPGYINIGGVDNLIIKWSNTSIAKGEKRLQKKNKQKTNKQAIKKSQKKIKKQNKQGKTESKHTE